MPIKAIARSAATNKAAAPIGRCLERAGAVHLGRRLSTLSASPPPTLTIPLPGRLFQQQSLSMYSADGHDAVALAAWRRGWDTYERRLPAFYAATIRDGDIVLDAGANTGYYSLLAASASGVDVHALEPYTPVADLLDRNLSLNPQGGQVTAHRVAVDDTVGEAELYIPLGDHGLVETSASIEASFRDTWSSSVTVPRTTIDHFAKRLARVDVMKIDVECLEDRVLEGASGTLRQHRPVVFYELLDCDDWHADCGRLDAIRRDADYVSVRLHQRAAVMAPAVGYDEPWRNQALWPAERIAALRQTCDRLGYRLTRHGR